MADTDVQYPVVVLSDVGPFGAPMPGTGRLATPFLDQDEYWVPQDSGPIRLEDMDASHRARADLDHAVWDHEVDKAEGVFTETQKLLTAALAAAIEETDAEDAAREAVDPLPRIETARQERRQALSALRQTDEEGTG